MKALVRDKEILVQKGKQFQIDYGWFIARSKQVSGSTII